MERNRNRDKNISNIVEEIGEVAPVMAGI